MKPTVEQQVEQLAADVERFAARTRPGTREIVIADDVKDVQAEWRIKDLDVLSSDYLDKLHTKKAREYDSQTAEADRAIAPQIPLLREAIGQAFAEARQLRTESMRVDPNLNPERYVNAKLLDEISQDRAERWLSEHEQNEAAILERYQKSDTRRDVAFIALVEERYGLTDEAPDESNTMTLPLSRAVVERQDKRIPDSLRTALETLDQCEGAYRIARAEAFPSAESLTRALGATLRMAR